MQIPVFKEIFMSGFNVSFENITLIHVLIAVGAIVVLIVILKILKSIFWGDRPDEHSRFAQCPQCKWSGRVSTYAGRCPQCGYTFGKQK